MRMRALAGADAPMPEFVGGTANTRTFAKAVVFGSKVVVLKKLTPPVIQIVKALALPPLRSIVMVTVVVFQSGTNGAFESERSDEAKPPSRLKESIKNLPDVMCMSLRIAPPPSE